MSSRRPSHREEFLYWVVTLRLTRRRSKRRRTTTTSPAPLTYVERAL
jgi:hypothetical protein